MPPVRAAAEAGPHAAGVSRAARANNPARRRGRRRRSERPAVGPPTPQSLCATRDGLHRGPPVLRSVSPPRRGFRRCMGTAVVQVSRRRAAPARPAPTPQDSCVRARAGACAWARARAKPSVRIVVCRSVGLGCALTTTCRTWVLVRAGLVPSSSFVISPAVVRILSLN